MINTIQQERFFLNTAVKISRLRLSYKKFSSKFKTENSVYESYCVLIMMSRFLRYCDFLRWWLYFGHVKIHLLLQFPIAKVSNQESWNNQFFKKICVVADSSVDQVVYIFKEIDSSPISRNNMHGCLVEYLIVGCDIFGCITAHTHCIITDAQK